MICLFLLVGTANIFGQHEVSPYTVEVSSVFPKKTDDILIPTLGVQVGFRYNLLLTDELFGSFGVGGGVSSGHIDFIMESDHISWENLFLKSLYAALDIRIGIFLDEKGRFILLPGAGLESKLAGYRSGRRYFLDEQGQIISQSDEKEWTSEQNLQAFLSMMLIHRFEVNDVDLYFGPYYHYGDLLNPSDEFDISTSKFGLSVGWNW